MSQSATIHIVDAVKLIRVYYAWPVLLLACGFMSYLPMFVPDTTLTKASFIYRVALFVVLIITFGKFNEIILNKNRQSWAGILKKYFLKFCGVGLFFALIAMVLFFTIGALYKSAGNEIGFLFIIFIRLFIINILMIYMIPLIFFDYSLFDSILIGFKCLIGNFKFTAPLISLSFIEGAIHSLPYISSGSKSGSIGLIASLSGILIDIIVFVSASMVLKDKLPTVDGEGIV